MPCSARSVASIWLGPLTRQRSARQQVAFTRRFGEIEFNVFGERWSVPGSPEIVVVSNATEHGRPIGVRRAGENWHSDLCYTARPPRGTMLYALEIPDLFGLALGDTEFASAAEAWDALPQPIKQRIDGRRAVFDFSGRKRAFPPARAETDRFPPVRHPIVRMHPHTGRKCLYVMRDDCTGIEGMEAEALIAALADHIVKPAFIYRHQWRPGDLLMWDNCTVQHRAVQDYDLPRRRLMHRTTMGGAVPI
jgi:taurine dioxygenase